LHELLTSAWKGEAQLPDFQRGGCGVLAALRASARPVKVRATARFENKLAAA
jgi:hypothetical protein